MSSVRFAIASLALAGCFSKPGFSGGNGGDGGGIDVPAGTNRVFVSSEKVIPGALVGVAKADERCQRLATMAGYEGTYVAYLSTSTQSAVERIAARGNPSGWVRPDGKPVAGSLDDLARGNHFYPVRYTEKLVDLYDSGEAVATATFGSTAADSGDTCGDYASTSGVIQFGIVDAQGRAWTEMSSASCGDSYRLYCVGVSFATPVSVTPPASARTVFVSRKIDPALGTTDFTAKCNADAASNAIGGTFVAGVATGTQSITSLVPTDRPFVRPDGVVVFEPAFGKNQAPVALDAGKRILDASIATGGTGFDVPAAAGESCANWSSHDASAKLRIGWSLRGFPAAAVDDHLGDCDEPELRVYCFQVTP